jgi:hypothetical protein
VPNDSVPMAPTTSGIFAADCFAPPLESCDVERRGDGTLLVRVHSRDRRGRPLPDAVFTFRKGDPQYENWEKRANCGPGDTC